MGDRSRHRGSRLPGGPLALAGLAAAPLWSAKTPSFSPNPATLNLGAIIITGASGGSVQLSPASPPGGSRPAPTGAVLVPSPATALGQFTLSGTAGDTWQLGNAGSASSSLTDGAGHRMTVAFSSATLKTTTPSGTYPVSGFTGTFQAGGVSNPVYVGVTVAFLGAAGNPAGTYSGFISIKAADGSKSGTGTVNISIQVVGGIALAKTQDLSFGAVFPGTSPGGTVVVPTSGSPTAPSGIVTLGSFKPGQPAIFNVTGTRNRTYSITLPGSVSLSDGAGHAMSADTFTSTPSGTGTLSALGAQTLTLGGTLHVGASQAEGDYSGTVNVTVAYN